MKQLIYTCACIQVVVRDCTVANKGWEIVPLADGEEARKRESVIVCKRANESQKRKLFYVRTVSNPHLSHHLSHNINQADEVLSVRGYKLVKHETSSVSLEPKTNAESTYIVTTSPDGGLVCA